MRLSPSGARNSSEERRQQQQPVREHSRGRGVTTSASLPHPILPLSSCGSFHKRKGQWGPAHPEVLGVQVFNGSSSRLLSPGPCNISKPLRSAPGAPEGHISFAVAYAVLQTSLGFDCVVFAQSLGAVQVRARQSRMRYTQRTRGRTRASSELGSAPGGLPLSRAGALWQAMVSKPHLHKAHLCTHSAGPHDVHKG